MHYHGDKRKGVVPLLPRFRRLGEIYAKRIDTWVSHLDDPFTLFLILYEHGFNHAKKAVDINEKVHARKRTLMLMMMMMMMMLMMMMRRWWKMRRMRRMMSMLRMSMRMRMSRMRRGGEGG